MSDERRPFSLKLFGGCALEGPGGLVTGRAAQRRRLACLAHIAAAGSTGASRDRLLALFWPESTTDQARHRLADTLYVLRAALGDDALVGSGERVVVNADVLRCDVTRFEEALGRGDLAGAATAYGGPFLDGFHVADAPEFERWVDGERERLAREAARAFAGLAQQRAASGDHTAAAEWWRRVAAQDPYSSRVAMHLMQALDAGGDHAAAIRHASVHAVLLREELGAEPDPAVLALAERLRRAPASVSDARVPAASPPGPVAAAITEAPMSPAATVVAAVAPPPGRHRWRATGLALLAGSTLAVSVLALRRANEEPGRTVSAAASPTGRRPTDHVAHDLYLRGRHYWSLDRPAEIRRGIDYFWRAVDRDPTYALAYAGIADGYARLDDMSALPAGEARPRALAAARRAIALDSTVAQAHAALAHVLMHHRRWAEAERGYRAALALDPDYASARLWYAVHLMAVGRPDEAARQARRARELDPLSVGVNWLAGSILGNVGRHAEAVAVLDGMLDRVPGHPGLRYARAVALVESGRHAEGAAEFERLGSRLSVARALALRGRAREARAIVRAEEARPAPASSPVSEHARRPTEFAVAYVALGEYDRAMDWLEREAASESNMILGIKADTRLAPLRTHPRFARLLRRLGVS